MNNKASDSKILMDFYTDAINKKNTPKEIINNTEVALSMMESNYSKSELKNSVKGGVLGSKETLFQSYKKTIIEESNDSFRKSGINLENPENPLMFKQHVEALEKMISKDFFVTQLYSESSTARQLASEFSQKLVKAQENVSSLRSQLYKTTKKLKTKTAELLNLSENVKKRFGITDNELTSMKRQKPHLSVKNSPKINLN